ncbi:MAG: DUF3553 domain-containing protein [Phycisphaerales bacterium]|nr:DUF3553 domain-containing protein [Phycisphaerales bacterium]
MLLKQWAFGDRVVHAGRPEWGVGIVAGVVAERHEGRACQKLTIRFDHAGIKTISTAHADLRPESELPMLGAVDPNPENDPLKAPAGPSSKEIMLRLPEAATDPFSTARTRVLASVAMYRFGDHPGALLDWAVAQSGLKDPMTRFNRHELEEFFRRWVQVRDEHFREMCFHLKRTDPALLAEALKVAPPRAANMIRKIDGVR